MWQAMALVITPDYKYRNPVEGTTANHPDDCLRLAKEYAQAMWPNDTMRRMRFIAELTVSEIRT